MKLSDQELQHLMLLKKSCHYRSQQLQELAGNCHGQGPLQHFHVLQQGLALQCATPQWNLQRRTMHSTRQSSR